MIHQLNQILLQNLNQNKSITDIPSISFILKTTTQLTLFSPNLVVNHIMQTPCIQASCKKSTKMPPTLYIKALLSIEQQLHFL